MILAGLVAEPIVFGEWDVFDLPEHERRMLEHWTSFRYRAPEVVPYLEIFASDGFGERRFSVRPMVPCVTVLV